MFFFVLKYVSKKKKLLKGISYIIDRYKYISGYKFKLCETQLGVLNFHIITTQRKVSKQP